MWIRRTPVIKNKNRWSLSVRPKDAWLYTGEYYRNTGIRLTSKFVMAEDDASHIAQGD